ncbi:MAG: monovalent cation/H(+) antiporter subunit G [archaeon]
MIADILFATSAFFALLGAIGLFRFPDFYTRIHAATMITIGGACLALASLAITTYTTEGYSIIYTIKIILIITFILITNPTSSHALAHAAYTTGIVPKNLIKNDLEQ